MRWAEEIWSYAWLGIVLLALLPVLALAAALQPLDPERKLAGRCFRRGAALLAAGVPQWRFSVQGELPPPGRAFVLIANHRSAADILALSLVLARAGRPSKWIVKEELFRVPWFGLLLRLAGDLALNRGDAGSGTEVVRSAARALEHGSCLVLFPEGTRSRDGCLGPFHPGAFQIALGAGAPIVPVAIAGSERCSGPGSLRPRAASVSVTVLPPIETAGLRPAEAPALAARAERALALALHTPRISTDDPPPPKLDRKTIEAAAAAGRCLLVQGAMGIMASDGLPGRVARIESARFLPVGTISGVAKPLPMVLHQIERSRREAPGGYFGLNLMAAINRSDFEGIAKAALAVGVSFLVQGAGISREIIRWCREARTPFAGIVSSGRLARLYESWGAEFLVVEGREAGGHLGDPDASLDRLLAEIRGATSLPLVAAGGLADGADIGRVLAAGAQGAQLATRFIATTDCEVHPNFKLMHMGRKAEDVVTIRSTVKGMRARAIRNAFTDRLNAGEVFPPKSKRRYYGPSGLHGRRKACDECLAEGLCTSRSSGHQESFCISDALLRAAIDGDVDNGLFYTGQSVERIPERTLDELKPVAAVVAELEAQLVAWEAGRQLTTASG
ncbi:MAG: nitronate monooxygenase [Myxococcales bacterium]